MIIVIDGYNVLKLVHSTKHVHETIRLQFLKQLADYGKRKGHSIMLVFDGGPYDMSTSERHGQATVVYAGYRETADDYIKRYLDEHRSKELLLVTHDRDLVNHALRYDIPTIDVWPFYERMMRKDAGQQRHASQSNGQLVKLHPEEVDDQLDALFQEAVILEKVEYEADLQREQAGKKQSKLAKSLESLLKKL